MWPFLFNILFGLLSDSHYARLRSLRRVESGNLVVYPLSHPLFPFNFKHFIFCDTHQVGPLLSVGTWLVTLHLWPTFRSHGDSRFLFRSWWGEDGVPWCHVGCLYIHRERCLFSCCMWANPHSSTSYPPIFMPIGWHCVFGRWYSHVGWCHHCWFNLNGLGFAHCIISGDGHDGGNFMQRKDFIKIGTLQTCFSFLPLRYLGVYINKLIIFFIVVLIWHELQRPLETFFFWFCMRFIGRGC